MTVSSTPNRAAPPPVASSRLAGIDELYDELLVRIFQFLPPTSRTLPGHFKLYSRYAGS